MTTSGPLSVQPDLQTLLSTPWIHERARLLEIVTRISEHGGVDHEAAADSIASARPDSAPALWFAERLLEPATDLSALSSTIADLSWAEALALGVVDAGVIGVVSLGETTRACIEALAAIRSELPVVRAPSSVIARGIDDIGVITEIGDPASADVCIVPLAASAPGLIWTSQQGAAVVEKNPATAIILDDPIRRLGAWARERWAPPEWLVAVKIPG